MGNELHWQRLIVESSTDQIVHIVNFLMGLASLGGIALALVWVGSMKTKVETMWKWWVNHAGRGTKIRMKDDGE